MICDIQKEILRLKKENDVCILAHSYQTREITEIADFVGDSYALSVKASKTQNKTLLMCGVRFMAETAKILSPDKKVILANPGAGCPMAEQFTVDDIREMKKKFPGYSVVAYINTTSEIKTECDVCVTSSSALKIVNAMENDKILFIPDINLGGYVARMCPNKKIVLVNGGCPIHSSITEAEVLTAKEAHPEALLLVHPECRIDVTSHADYVGSTAGIMEYAEKSEAKEFIIGTENSIVSHLEHSCPDKRFYPLSKRFICPDMKLTTLNDVYLSLKGEAGEEIVLSEPVMKGAKACIDEMIRLG